MAFFSKRKRNEEFKKQLEREALDKMDQGGILPYETVGITVGTGKPHHPSPAHVITAAELKGEETGQPVPVQHLPEPTAGEPIGMAAGQKPDTASDFLFKRMTEARQAAAARYTAQNSTQPQGQNAFTQPEVRQQSAVQQPTQTAAPQAAKAAAPQPNQPAEPGFAPSAPNFKIPIAPRPTQAAAQNASAATQQARPATPKVPVETARAAEPKAAPEVAPQEPFDLNAAINSLKNAAGLMSGSVTANRAEKPAPAAPAGSAGQAKAAPSSSPVRPAEPAPQKPNLTLNQKAKPAAQPAAGSAKAAVNQSQQISSAIDRDVSKIAQAQKAAATAEQRRKTLLDRCNAYLADDTVGVVQPDTSRYKLESVESILSGFEDRATQKVLRSLNLPMPEKAAPQSAPKAAEQKTELSPEPAVRRVPLASSADISSYSGTETEKLPGSGTVKHIAFQNPTAPRSAAAKISSAAADSATRHIDLSGVRPQAVAPEAAVDATQTFKKFKEQEPVLPKSEPQSDLPAEENADQSETEKLPTADYRTVGDKDAVNAALLAAGKKLRLRAFANTVLLIGAVLFSTLLAGPVKAAGSTAFYAVHLVLTLLIAAVNLPVLKGLKAFVSKEKSMDCGLAAAIVLALLQAVLAVAGVRSQLGFPLSGLLALSATLYSFGRLSAHRRVCANFSVIANEKLKNALHIVSNHTANLAMGQRAVGEDVLICCGSKTKNVEDFLAYSYCKNPLVNRAKKIALVGLIMALGLGVAAAFITTMDAAYAVFIAGVVSCIAAAPATLLIPNFPLRSAAKRLNGYGAMLTGYKACAELDRCNAVAVTAGQLFPEDSVCMIDMRPLSPNPIDKTILDAYSVTAQIGSPLAGMFKQINNTTDLVPKKADTVMYEEKMGVSGWVDKHRVFVGNRILMEAHGFKALPPLELDKKILRKGYFPVYLACDNAVCAIFVVKYCPNEEVAYELSRLCNTGTTILVKNCDPNLSEKMLCDYFGLYEDSISIMNKQGCDYFDTAAAYQESRSAGASFGKSVCGFFAAMTAAIQIKSLFYSMSALYVVTVVLGILATAIAVFTAPALLSSWCLLAYQLIATLLICLPAVFKRP